MQNEVSKLIEYRKKQAIQSINDVELFIENKKLASEQIFLAIKLVPWRS